MSDSFLNGSEVGAPSSGGGGYSEGPIWTRPAPSAGLVFIDADTEVAYQASASAWRICLASGSPVDKAGLALDGVSARSVVATGLDLSMYTSGNATFGLLWTWDGPMPGPGFSVLGVVGKWDGTEGVQILAIPSGGDIQLIADTGAGAGITVLKTYSPAATFVGLHALAIAPVVVGGTHYWRYSVDGDAVTDVAMPVPSPYAPPSSSAELGLGSRSAASSSVAGAVHELSVWGSLLSSADILALATLPGTPTYRLPLSSSTGHPAIRAEACRWDAMSPTLLVAYGLAAGLTVTGVRKVTY